MCVAPWSPDFMPEQQPLTKAQVMVEFRGIPYRLLSSRVFQMVKSLRSLSPTRGYHQSAQIAKYLDTQPHTVQRSLLQPRV
uniref:Uncharacterized protein n=1 Tax=Noccaea caerulescens TaxID=107243 RepID=A0A1J3JI03_NOCCA